MSFIALKVNFVQLKSVKTIQYPVTALVQDVCINLHERMADPQSDGKFHGLFFPGINKWMDMNRSLDFFDLKSGDLVEYKKKTRALRIRFVDEALKTILIDESRPVREVVDAICERIGLSNPAEYSIMLDTSALGNKDTKARSSIISINRPEPTIIDEDHWLAPDKTLPEQNVTDADIVLLKKKFFFSDQNVDRNDPVQLNLLYVQSRDAIVSGKHPCKYDEAAQLGALQCQIHTGNHEPDKHKHGFLELNDYVPPEYRKDKKAVGKQLFIEHRKLQGMTTINAKYRYVQLCRSLKTYGVTFFLVKEKVKKKMTSCLLGVTRDSVMRLDPDTKETLQKWPLTSLRRWSAAPNTFTMDFGDYSDSYIIMQTEEGEAISQLIGGYIDIIMKKRKDASTGNLVDDQNLKRGVMEENVVAMPGKTASTSSKVAPSRANQMEISKGEHSAQNSHAKSTQDATKKNKHSAVQDGEIFNVDSFATTENRQNIAKSLKNGFSAITASFGVLKNDTKMPQLGNDSATALWIKQTQENSRQIVSSQLASFLSSTCSIINQSILVATDSVDTLVASSHISTLSANLTELSTAIKILASLSSPDQNSALLDMAKSFAQSTSFFFETITPVLLSSDAPSVTHQQHKDLLRSCQEIGSISSRLLELVGENEVSVKDQTALIAAARHVAKESMELVNKGAKSVAADCSRSSHLSTYCEKIVEISKKIASSTEVMVTTTIITSPMLNLTQLQDRVVESTVLMLDDVSELTRLGEVIKPHLGVDNRSLMEMQKCVFRVNEALAKMVAAVKNPQSIASEDGVASARIQSNSNLSKQYEKVLISASKALREITVSRMLKRCKPLSLAMTDVVHTLKKRATASQSADDKTRYLGAAKILADATNKMVAVAKEITKNPKKGDDKVMDLRRTVENIQTLTCKLTGKQIHINIIFSLAKSIKAASSSIAQVIAAAKGISPSNRNQNSQMQLIATCKVSVNNFRKLIECAREFKDSPKDSGVQRRMIHLTKAVMSPISRMLVAAKAAAANTQDLSLQVNMTSAMNRSRADMIALAQACDLAESVTSGFHMENVIASVAKIGDDFANLVQFMQSDNFTSESSTSLPSQSLETMQADLTISIKAVSSHLALIVSSARLSNQQSAGAAAREISAELQFVFSGTEKLAQASTDRNSSSLQILDRKIMMQIVPAGADVAKCCLDILKTAQVVLDAKNSSENDARLMELDRNSRIADAAIAQWLASLPAHRDLEHASKIIEATAALIDCPPVNPIGTTVTAAMIQKKLLSISQTLTNAFNGVTAATRDGSIANVRVCSKQIGSEFGLLVSCLNDLIAVEKRNGTTSSDGNEMAVSMQLEVKNVAVTGQKLLSAAMSYNASPSGSSSKILFNEATLQLTAALGKLLEISSSSRPGVAEFNQVQQELFVAISKVDSVNDSSMAEEASSYFSSYNSFIQAARRITQMLDEMVDASGKPDIHSLIQCVHQLGDNALEVSTAASRATFLIAANDERSIASETGIVNQVAYTTVRQELDNACANILRSENTQKDLLNAAGDIAKITSYLVSSCRQAAANPRTSAICRQQFLLSAKLIASSTGTVVVQIKQLVKKPSNLSRAACSAAFGPLISDVASLVAFGMSPDFRATEATVSPMALERQRPIVLKLREFLKSSTDVLNVARHITASPGNSEDKQHMIDATRQIGDTLKVLTLSLRVYAPGQAECGRAILKIEACIESLKAASESLTGSSTSSTAADSPVNGSQEYIAALAANVNALRSAHVIMISTAKGSVHNDEEETDVIKSELMFGPIVIQFSDNFVATAETIIQLAKVTAETSQRAYMLDAFSQIARAMIANIDACKLSAGDDTASEAHQKVDASAQKFISLLMKLHDQVCSSNSESRELDAIMDGVQRSLQIIDNAAVLVNAEEDSDVTEVPEDYQNSAMEIFDGCEVVGSLIMDAMTVGEAGDITLIKPLTESLGSTYYALVNSVKNAALRSAEPEIKQNLLDAARDIGSKTTRLIDGLKQIMAASSNDSGKKDSAARQKVENSVHELADSLTLLQASTKEGSKMLTGAENSIQSVLEALVEFDSMLLFSIRAADNFDTDPNAGKFKSEIVESTNNVLQAVKGLVVACASGDLDPTLEQILSSLNHFRALKDICKNSMVQACSGNTGLMEEFLKATKLMGEHLVQVFKDVMGTTGKVSAGLEGFTTIAGMSTLPPEIVTLKNSASKIVNDVADCHKIIQQLDEEKGKSMRALENVSFFINEAVQAFDTPLSPSIGAGALPDEVSTAAKNLVNATTMLSSAALRPTTVQSQNEMISVSFAVKKCVAELLKVASSSTAYAPQDKKSLIHDVISRTTLATSELLEKIRQSQENPLASTVQSSATRADIESLARRVDTLTNDVVEAAASLDRLGYVDASNPHMMAERDILASAVSIDSAAFKMAALKPSLDQRDVVADANQGDVGFQDQILELTKTIMAASATFIRAASAAQHEVIVKERNAKLADSSSRKLGDPRDRYKQAEKSAAESPHYLDGSWSQGLVSGAKEVASAISDLCETANAASKGEVRRERVVVIARSVHASTTSLLTAAAVRTDPHSDAQNQLRAAASSIQRATDRLVRAAEESIIVDEDEHESNLNDTGVTKQRAQELEAQMRVLQMERELELARKRLAGVRKDKYAKK